MARRRVDDWDDDDANGVFDNDPHDDTVPCPYCRREIPEDTPRCPYCENYISEEDAPPTRKPWWIIIAVGICLLIVAMWILQ